MATDLDQLAGDVPLGAVGRLLGLRIVSLEMQDGKEVRWSARANMVQQRVRSVGGRLHLTDRRLMVGRSRAESLVGGKEWSAALPSLASPSAMGKRTISIEDATGRVERFLVKSPEGSAETIDRAIGAAASSWNPSGPVSAMRAPRSVQLHRRRREMRHGVGTEVLLE